MLRAHWSNGGGPPPTKLKRLIAQKLVDTLLVWDALMRQQSRPFALRIVLSDTWQYSLRTGLYLRFLDTTAGAGFSLPWVVTQPADEPPLARPTVYDGLVGLKRFQWRSYPVGGHFTEYGWSLFNNRRPFKGKEFIVSNHGEQLLYFVRRGTQWVGELLPA